MASNASTLISQYDKLIKPDGTPTDYFLRILQLRGNLVTDIETAVAQALATNIIAGAGLNGGGQVGAGDITIDAVASDILDLISDVHGTVLFRGASAWEALAPGTAGQFLKTNGAGADPEWAAGGGGGGGGLYDISMGVPASMTTLGNGANFSWVQNGTVGANVKKNANALSSSCAGWVIPKTSGAAWESAALFLQNNYGARFYGTQIGLHNSSSGRLITLADFQGSYNNTEFQRWNNSGSRNDVPNNYGDAAHAQGPAWLHIKDDGSGNIQLGRSADGANPVWMKSTTTGDWVGAYDNVFVGGFFETNVNVTGASVSVLCYDPNGASRVVGV